MNAKQIEQLRLLIERLEQNYDFNDVKKKIMYLQVGLSMLIGLVILLSSNHLAILLGDSNLSDMIKITALITPFYAITSFQSGLLHGLSRFNRLSLQISIYSMIKLILTVGVALYTKSIFGVVAGLLISYIFSAIVGIFLTKSNPVKGKPIQ